MKHFLGIYPLPFKAWKVMGISLLFVGMLGIVSCSPELKTPCANYGLWCQKTPINAWDKARN